MESLFKLNFFFFLFLLIFGISFISAGIYDSCEIYGNCEPTEIVNISGGNYSINVNNSNYWDGNAWSDTRWLNIDGSNANTNIDIGAYDFYANEFFGSFLGDWNGSSNYLLNTGDTASGDYNFDSNTLFIDASTSRVGIGTTSPQSLLHVYNNTSLAVPQETLRAQGIWAGAGSGPLLRFTNYHGSGDNPNSLEYNLAGIAGRDFAGNWAGGLVFMTPNSGDAGGSALVDRMVIREDGNVGIGTASPGERLTVLTTGTHTYMELDTDAVDKEAIYRVSDQGTAKWSFGKRTDDKFGIYGHTATAGWKLVIEENTGNVGIGTASPNESLVVDGNIWADNFYVTSDRDLKTNIKVVESSSFGNLYRYNLNKSRPIFELQNLTREIEVCEEVLITEESEVCSLDKENNETSCLTLQAEYETQCNNETEEYQESINIGTEYYDSENYIGLMTDELDEDFVKTTDGTSRINLYGLISKIWVLLGGYDDKIKDLENENQLLKLELCKKDITYSWCK